MEVAVLRKGMKLENRFCLKQLPIFYLVYSMVVVALSILAVKMGETKKDVSLYGAKFSEFWTGQFYKINFQRKE